MGMTEVEKLIEIYKRLEDAGLMVIGGKKDSAELMVSNDVVPVVRCKDCMHGIWDEENEMWKCVESADYDEEIREWFGFYEYHNGDFFCADGERRENGKSKSAE